MGTSDSNFNCFSSSKSTILQSCNFIVDYVKGVTFHSFNSRFLHLDEYDVNKFGVSPFSCRSRVQMSVLRVHSKKDDMYTEFEKDGRSGVSRFVRPTL